MCCSEFCLVVSGRTSSPSIPITRLDSYPVSPEDASLFRYGRSIVWMLVSENNVQQPTRNIQYPRQIHKNLVGWKFLVGYWIFSPSKNLMSLRNHEAPLNSEQAFACFSHYTSRDACATSGHSFLCFRRTNVAVEALSEGRPRPLLNRLRRFVLLSVFLGLHSEFQPFNRAGDNAQHLLNQLLSLFTPAHGRIQRMRSFVRRAQEFRHPNGNELITREYHDFWHLATEISLRPFKPLGVCKLVQRALMQKGAAITAEPLEMSQSAFRIVS
jgi:hypothetical protein